MQRDELINMVQPLDSSGSCVIMIYDKGNMKPVFLKAIQCSSKHLAKQWLKDKKYIKQKELGYHINRKKERIANILPTQYYR